MTSDARSVWMMYAHFYYNLESNPKLTSISFPQYQPDDPVLKLADCSHWLHRECLQVCLSSDLPCFA